MAHGETHHLLKTHYYNRALGHLALMQIRVQQLAIECFQIPTHDKVQRIAAVLL